jgi:hypothetical protein
MPKIALPKRVPEAVVRMAEYDNLPLDRFLVKLTQGALKEFASMTGYSLEEAGKLFQKGKIGVVILAPDGRCTLIHPDTKKRLMAGERLCIQHQMEVEIGYNKEPQSGFLRRLADRILQQWQNS